MRLFKIEYTIKGQIDTAWIRAASSTIAIREVFDKVGNREKYYFRMLSIKEIKN